MVPAITSHVKRLATYNVPPIDQRKSTDVKQITGVPLHVSHLSEV